MTGSVTTQAGALPRGILIFIHSLHGGGAERVAVDLAAQWAEAGVAVTLVTQADVASDVYALHPAVARVSLGTAGESGGGLRGLLANVRRVRALRAQIVRVQPDIVLGMMTTASVLAVLAARGLPAKVIATEHTHPPSQSLSGLWLRLRRWTYPRAAQVVALTRDTAKWIETHVPGSRLAVIPNPVQWPLRRQSPELAPPGAQAGHILLGVGRLHPDKGFDVLLKAFAQLAPEHPEWRLVLLGEGTERARLTAQAEALGLGGRVDLPGRAGNVGDWYARADLYVLSSRVEGLSNTLLEAMASGLAPVAFDCETGPREIVRDGEDGLLVRPVEDPQALAAALGGLMRDPARREALATQAVAVRERFSTASVLARWKAVFDDALAGR
ncbi:Glycosyl transferase, group 1 family protein [plant metagenome]|uniref:Glycosyl transferase, group 1 family protein n=1 Tax=plant metagenome TaxID=1297885 RepID=A0A484S6R9_9ZZZZ